MNSFDAAGAFVVGLIFGIVLGISWAIDRLEKVELPKPKPKIIYVPRDNYNIETQKPYFSDEEIRKNWELKKKLAAGEE